jgi:hypothetical protein
MLSSYDFYKWLHVSGVLSALVGLGGGFLTHLSGVLPAGPGRRAIVICHGVGLLAAAVGGFGMLARGGFPFPWPAWVFGKIAIWFALGGLMALPMRSPRASRRLWWLPLALSIFAVFLVLYRP